MFKGSLCYGPVRRESNRLGGGQSFIIALSRLWQMKGSTWLEAWAVGAFGISSGSIDRAGDGLLLGASCTRSILLSSNVHYCFKDPLIDLVFFIY